VKEDVTAARGLDSRQNSLNFLRLVFAVAVIASHTASVGGYGREPELLGVTIGTWAVAGFFAISGYLIANSRTHRDFGGFLVRRILRIYPGYLVCLVLTALVFAPLGAAIGSGEYKWSSALGYLYKNSYLKINQYDISSTLDHVPYPKVWDGSLWTLRHEFICYLLVAAVLTLRRHRLQAVLAAFVALAAIAIFSQHHSHPAQVGTLSLLASTFFAGSLIALLGERISLTWKLAVPACAVLVASALAGEMNTLGAIPLAYICLWLGRALPFHKVGRRNDISYGIYIYGMPVQQLLVLAHVQRVSAPLFTLIATVATIPLAMASWFWVERPALRAAGRFDTVIRRQLRMGPPLPTPAPGKALMGPRHARQARDVVG